MNKFKDDNIDPNRRIFFSGLALGVGAAMMIPNGGALAQTQTGVSVESNSRFAGKVVAITGGNSGIGEATVRAFAAAGAKVMFCARRDALGRKVEADIRSSGGDATWMRADVRDHHQVKAFIDATISKYGRLDVLFNNAGIFMTPAEFADIPVENFRDMLATNVEGEFYGMKYALPVMTAQKSGVIVNMASVAAHKGFPNTAHYCASKHAVLGLTKSAASVSAKSGVRVVSLSPLAVDTPMLRESFAYQKLTYEQVAPNFVTPRIMNVTEIASAVMFLASDEASSLNGMDLDVTGGQLV